VKILCESRKERRASVIQSDYFRTTVVKQWKDDKRNDKIVAKKA
jgi:hypothetical protein